MPHKKRKMKRDIRKVPNKSMIEDAWKRNKKQRISLKYEKEKSKKQKNEKIYEICEKKRNWKTFK